MARPIYFQGTHEQCVDRIYQFVLEVTGTVPVATSKIMNGVYGAIGMAALTDIKTDFVRKARGEVGEDGVKWKPLAESTIKRRRKGPTTKGEKDKQLLQRIELALYARLIVSMPPAEAMKEAKRQAAVIVKSKDQAMIDVLAPEMGVEILRDTGRLLASLSPGRMTREGAYTPPRLEEADDQAFDFIRGGVIVGTNVEYAGTHQYGDEDRNIPARPFLPVEHVPQAWLDRWTNTGETAVAVAFELYLTGAL